MSFAGATVETSTSEPIFFVFRPDTREHPCRVYWGSHGCRFERGHEEPHECVCCPCGDHEREHELEGCVAKPPYYGADTHFYGEDAPDGD